MAVLKVTPKVYRTEHQKQTQQGIGGGCVRHGPRAKTGDMDHGRHCRGAPTPAGGDKATDRQSRHPSGQRRRQAHRELIHAENQGTERLQPINTDGFVKTVGTIEGGVAPIT